MKKGFTMKSRSVMRLLSIAVIASILPSGFAWGALQPPLSQITNPVFGTSGGKVPATVPPNLSPYVKDVTAAIRLGKALFWDMQAGSDGVTACASCHYRAGADPVVGTAPKLTAMRNKNQLHPGPDAIFGNNSTVIRTFDPLAAVTVPVILRATEFLLDPLVPGVYRFAPNYTLDILQNPFDPLDTIDFPLFLLNPPTARLVIDPLTGLTGDAVLSLRDTNDVVGSQGIRLADFLAINNGSTVDSSNPITPTGPRQVTGRNTPSVINAVFNYTNFWDGRANNIFNGETPFGPLDQTAGIWIDNGTALVKQKIAIPNASLASQAVGPALSDVEMSFKGRTFPELGRKMLALAPLATQFVHPQDGVLGALSRDPVGNNTGSPGIDVSVPGQGNNTYKTMIEAAFVDTLWNSGNKVTLATNPVQGPVQFDQIEANFSLFWGLAIQLYEATLVSDRSPFDRFQAGNQNALTVSEQIGFTTFDSKCTICHSGSEFSSAVVGSNNCLATTSVIDCNRVAFTNNSTHSLIKQDVNPELGAPPPSLIDAGFFNIGVRPTADDPGRGGSASFIDPVTQNQETFPLSFTQLALQAAQSGLPFVTPKPPILLPAKVKGSFKTPGLRNVELTAPYFHNGDALTLEQVVEFYTRGGNFPGNFELASAMQPIGNLRNDPIRRADIAAFLKKLTDDRVRNETAPFDHPALMIPNGVDGAGNDLPLITLEATGGAPAAVAPGLILDPVVTPTDLTSQVISGTISDTAKATTTVAVRVNGGPAAVATVNCVLDAAGIICVPSNAWSFTATGLKVGSNIIEVIATDVTADGSGGGVETIIAPPIQVLPTAIISGTPTGGRTKENFATLTIGGGSVASYQYSLDGGLFSADRDILTTPTINLTNLSDATHTVTVLAKDVNGNQQLIATTATWTVKANPPVLTLNDTSKPTGSSTQTINGTVELGSRPSVSVDTSATVGTVRTIGGTGINTWSCEITGLAGGANTVTVIATDTLFNTTTVKGLITRVLRDGNFKGTGTGTVDITDALKALRIAVDLEQATVTDMLHGDIAPLVDGLTTQNDRIDIADALLILRKLVGLVTF